MTLAFDQFLPMPDLAGPDLPAGSLGDLTHALDELDDAHDGYVRAREYFEGNFAEYFASPRLRRALLRSGVLFRFNFARIPVAAVAERLQLAAVTTEGPAGQALHRIWLDNKMALQSRQILLRASEFGDAYVMVWPNPDDPTRVDMFYNSPTCVRVFYDPENQLVKSHAVKRWEVEDGTRADLYYPDRIEKWVTKPGATGTKAGDWMPYVDNDGDPWPYDNPFGQIPIFHFRNDWPYGQPEHYGFYGPQDAIHKLVLSHLAGVDYQSFPQRWAMLNADTDTSEAADADEDVFSFADTGTGATVPPAGEARSQFTADPGSLWMMRGVTSVGQFDTADHHNFTEPMVQYLRFGAEITNTPLHRVDPTGDHPSGESLRTAEAPFVAKIVDRQLSYGDEARDMFSFALRVAGYPGAEVTVRWAPAQTINDFEGWQTVGLKIATGVPRNQAMLEAGYSEEQVRAWNGDAGDRPTPAPVPPVGSLRVPGGNAA